MINLSIRIFQDFILNHSLAVISIFYIAIPTFLLLRHRYFTRSKKMASAPMEDTADFPDETYENFSDLQSIQSRTSDITTNPDATSVADGDDLVGGLSDKETFIRVHYGTNRDLIDVIRKGKVESGYGYERGALRLGYADVSMPKVHELGKIERPNKWLFRKRSIPGKHVYVSECTELPKADFLKLLDSNESHALLFIHGFKTTFMDGLRRSAQLAYDLSPGRRNSSSDRLPLEITPFYFSWPSKGKADGYVRDQLMVDNSEDDFTQFLKLLKQMPEIEKVTIIAHSMGNRLLTRVLRNVSKEAKRNELPQIEQVILAAPDIDRTQFELWELSIKSLCKRVTIYASDKDWALKASKTIAQYKRLGDASDPMPIFKYSDTIDASDCGEDFLGHTPHGQKTVLSDLYDLIRNDTPPKNRFWLDEHKVAHGTYWSMKDFNA